MYSIFAFFVFGMLECSLYIFLHLTDVLCRLCGISIGGLDGSLNYLTHPIPCTNIFVTRQKKMQLCITIYF